MARFDDKPLTSPNDCVVSRKTGSIYFTDPAYGTIDVIGHGGEVHQPTNNVYRLDPTSGEINVLDNSFAQPNGLCFSPDETLLYVSDSGAIEPLSSVKYDAEKVSPSTPGPSTSIYTLVQYSYACSSTFLRSL